MPTLNEINEALKYYATEERCALLEERLSKRTDYMTLVTEDIFSSHNQSALLRTCECFGIQDVHIIENRNHFTLHPDIVRGATKWLTINWYNKAGENNTATAIAKLKEKGYRIVATTPHVEGCVSLPDFDVTKGKFAIVMGSENEGISETMRNQADELLTIPMFGFTESLNISVATAIILQSLRQRLTDKGIGIGLNPDYHTQLMHKWLMSSIRSAKEVEKYVINKLTTQQ